MYIINLSFAIGVISAAIGGIFLWLYTRRKKDGEYLFFSLMCFSSAVYSFFATGVQLNQDDPVRGLSFRKIMMCGPILMIPSLLHFLNVFTRRKDKFILNSADLISVILCLMSIFEFHFYSNEVGVYDMPFSEKQYVQLKPGLGFMLLLPYASLAMGYAIMLFVSGYKKRIKFITPILIGVLLLWVASIYDMLWVTNIIPMIFIPSLEYGFLALVICMAFTLISRYVYNSSELEKLTDSLNEQVRQRTRELANEKQKLETAVIDLKTTNEKLKTTQAQLVQSEKMATIGTLAGGVAHEINNPMTAILSSSQRILKFPKDLDKHLKSASTIEKASRNATAIIEHLLFYSRNTNSHEERIDLNQIVEHTLQKNKRTRSKVLIKKNLKLLPVIRGSSIELERLLRNLLDNAYDALDEVGKKRDELTITISTEKCDECIKLKIADNGTGIAEKDLPHIFDPFFTSKPVGKGTGLGLWLVYWIVENHHGTIEARNLPDGGTEFEVSLPLSSN